MENRLYRDENAKVIGGVCAGLAEYFNIDVALVRAVFVCAMIIGGASVPLYFILWIVVPRKNPFITPRVDYTVPPEPLNIAPVRRRPGTAAIIAGTVLIVLGAFFLMDQFDIIPYLAIQRFWPVIFIILGIAVIFSPERKKHTKAPWDKNEPSAPANNDSENLNTL